MMSPFVIFSFQFLLTLVSFGLIAKFYIFPKLKRLPLFEALTILCFFHAFRVLGLTYLVPGVSPDLIPANFAAPVAYGDFITALLAIVAIIFLRKRFPGAIALAWLVNIVGCLDFANGIYLGISQQGWNYHVGPLWFFSTFIVPPLIVAHVMAFILLLKKRPQT